VSNSALVLSIPFTSANVPEPGKFKFNWARWKDPALDKLLGDAAAATSPEEAAKLYAEAQRKIMEAAIFMPVHDQIQTVVHASKLKGLRYAVGQWQVRLHEVDAAN
jgi:peptide/nickel transport system substrate-binding protein